LPGDQPLHSGAIYNLKYNHEGNRLASSGGDSSVFIMKLPPKKFKFDRIPLVGHELPVNSID
jgi:WD40 repeat protein